MSQDTYRSGLDAHDAARRLHAKNGKWTAVIDLGEEFAVVEFDEPLTARQCVAENVVAWFVTAEI